MKYIIVLVLFISLFSSCKTQKNSTSSTRDSTYVEKVVPVYIQLPADSSWYWAWFKCDSTGHVVISASSDIKTKGISTDVSFDNGKFNYKTNRPADSIKVITINKEIRINTELSKTFTVTVIKMSLFQKIFFWIGIGSILLFIILLYLKFKP